LTETNNLLFLFSGVGRLDVAFEQVCGFGNSLVVECERAFLGSLAANICQNRPSRQVICAELRELNPLNYFDNMEHPIGVMGGHHGKRFPLWEAGARQRTHLVGTKWMRSAR